MKKLYLVLKVRSEKELSSVPVELEVEDDCPQTEDEPTPPILPSSHPPRSEQLDQMDVSTAYGPAFLHGLPAH